ncbi:MAG: response regulator [Desulfobacteraceae bacterium]|nr:MAG: response regulator [Desulfobacteraceae bacterium]
MDEFSVLLVDDEKEFLETLLKRLRKRRIKVTGANSGEEAIKIVKETPPDVVVLDVRMQGMDGIQTLAEIKKIRPAIEVIMLTGHANLDVAVEGMDLGAFDYLMKPTDVDELLYKLEDAFKRKIIKERQTKSL